MRIGEEILTVFFREAFSLQAGEYHPHLHLKNVEDLAEKYPWPESVVDCLYRVACHFGGTVESLGRGILKQQVSLEAAFEELSFPIFFYIPPDLRRDAMKNFLEERDYPYDFDSE